jgi:hypothetical protein
MVIKGVVLWCAYGRDEHFKKALELLAERWNNANEELKQQKPKNKIRYRNNG